jgi:putative ABC transport system permease protein
MKSLAFLRQMLQDVRHQKLRTLLTLLGITWGTVSVSLLVAFGEGLQKRIVKNQRGLGENIVIAWPAATSLPFEGLGKGRRIRVSEDDIEVLRREIPEATFSGEHESEKNAFRRDRVRLTPQISANSPIFAAMRNIIPAEGGRYVNDLDVDRRRRVVFLGDKLKQDLFGENDALGKTVMIDNVPFLVIGVMAKKAQDSSYSGRDESKAFMPDSTYRGLFSERYVDNFIFQARGDAAQVPLVTQRVYQVLGRLHQFDPKDKEAVKMWDTTEQEKFFRVFFGVFRAFLAIIGSFTLIVGGIGVSNIMYVVVEERTREIGVKLAVGAKPGFIQRQFLAETLTLTAVGGVLGLLVTVAVIAAFPAQLDEYVGTPEASPLVIATTTALLGLIGAVAGYFPARRASLLDPVVALKLA